MKKLLSLILITVMAVSSITLGSIISNAKAKEYELTTVKGEGTKSISVKKQSSNTYKLSSTVRKYYKFYRWGFLKGGECKFLSGNINSKTIKIKINSNCKITTKNLLKPVTTDKNYKKYRIKLSKQNRKKIENIVTNESNGSYNSCLLIAQLIKDNIHTNNNVTTSNITKQLGFKKDTGTPSKDAKKAVKFVFDEGGYAVKHRILYRYSSSDGIIKTSWHESQLFIIQHINARYFDKK